MAERTIKVDFFKVVRSTLPGTGISFVLAVLFWKLVPLSYPVQLVSIALSSLLFLFLLQLRFSAHMTVAAWTRLWGSLAPVFASSLVTLTYFPFLPLLVLLVVITLVLGIWSAYRFHPLVHDGRLHRARFASLDEMETLFEKQPCHDGLVLGTVKQFFFFRHYVCIRPTKGKKEIGHSLIVARTGGGKSSMNIGQITALDDASMIINDPKGELFLETAGYRATRGPVFVLDPTRGVGHCYDPLRGKTTEDDYSTIAKVLVFEPGSHDAYWNNSAARMIEPLFKAARIEDTPPIPYLRHMIRLGLPAVAKRLNSLDPKLATSFLGVTLEEANLTDNRTIYGIWSTLQTQLTPFLTETIVRCFAGSDISAEMIMRGERPVTVYLRLQEGHLKRLSPFVRLVVESLMKDLTDCWEQVRGAGCRRVFFDLEEAGITPLPNLDEYVSTGRSKGFIFQIFYQSISQLADNYGSEKAQNIMENMDTTLFLRPNNKKTAEEIQEWLGKGSQFSQSKNYREGSEFSEGLSEQAIPVMTARDIMEMHDKYAIVFYSDFKPMKILRLKWWQIPRLRKRHNLPVPSLQPLPDIPPLPELVLSKPSGFPLRFVDPDQPGSTDRQIQSDETNHDLRHEHTILDFSVNRLRSGLQR